MKVSTRLLILLGLASNTLFRHCSRVQGNLFTAHAYLCICFIEGWNGRPTINVDRLILSANWCRHKLVEWDCRYKQNSRAFNYTGLNSQGFMIYTLIDNCTYFHVAFISEKQWGHETVSTCWSKVKWSNQSIQLCEHIRENPETPSKTRVPGSMGRWFSSQVPLGIRSLGMLSAYSLWRLIFFR